jgi:hypothetical protein
MVDAVNYMSPVISVEGYPVDEERGRALPLLEVGDTPGLDVGKAAAGMKGRNIHGLSSRIKLLSGRDPLLPPARKRHRHR